MDNNNAFHFNYSVRDRDAAAAILELYGIDDSELKVIPLQELEKFDQHVTLSSTIISILVGLAGLLIFGSGLSMVTVWTSTLFVPGIIVGVLGMAVMGAALPIYNRLAKKARQQNIDAVKILCGIE